LNETAIARTALRQRLRAERDAHAAGAGYAVAHAALAAHLAGVLAELEPACLGLYWSIRAEFNAVAALAADPFCNSLSWALPYTRREPREMHYRRWDRQPPAQRDECGIPAPDGRPVVPDVVLVPCVGFTAEGWRLGYGGGYFDRWLAAHPHATAVGVAWAAAEIEAREFAPQAHDLALTLIVTERGVR